MYLENLSFKIKNSKVVESKTNKRYEKYLRKVAGSTWRADQGMNNRYPHWLLAFFLNDLITNKYTWWM